MSDQALDPFQQLAALPKGGVFILRHYESSDRHDLAAGLLAKARAQRKQILIASDMRLAYRLHAHGLHYPEWQLDRLRRVHRWRSDWLISASAHSLKALLSAARAGVDWIILSPIFIAKQQKALGICRLADYARQTELSVFALGGVISTFWVRRLSLAPIAGIASTRGFHQGTLPC